LRYALIFSILFVLTACAGAPVGPPVEIKAPPAGKAQIYLIRPRTIIGAGNLQITAINGPVVAQLQVGQYTVVPVDPGTTVLTFRERIQGPLPLLDLRLLQELAGFNEIGRVDLKVGQSAFMEYYWMKFVEEDEASRLLGGGVKYVPPVGPAGRP